MVNKYYVDLFDVVEKGEYDCVFVVVRKYGIESGKVWFVICDDMFKDLVD